MSNSITILSYNTHLFIDSVAAVDPKLIYKDTERKEDILNKIESHSPPIDVIGLTEVWAHKTQDYFKNNLTEFDTFAYQEEPTLSGSSGMCLSVRGNLHSPPIGFRKYNNMLHADKLSCKGVSYGRVTLQNGQEIYLIQTHTQASYTGSESADAKARKDQIRDVLLPIFTEALQNFKSGPVFLLGDLNIIGGSEEYKEFSQNLYRYGIANGREVLDAWPAFSEQPGITYDPNENSLVKRFDNTQEQPQRLDYIFFTADKAKITNIEIPHWKYQESLNDSDHYPIIATFRLKQDY